MNKAWLADTLIPNFLFTKKQMNEKESSILIPKIIWNNDISFLHIYVPSHIWLKYR